ncbi:hypothetical protein H257_02196 [Aphanomyces astaci]|uniref:Uncharacterized protein n=1 Tax=Aphanomyces astaci TaxID=112090 RepID=W4H5F5_APHAT|nr:hypothetical protein H257_02196 [Aphanomyces astaci]ETV87235.1 hypothetical protein H257_02196 [Aphanomyces astaci]RQM22184.1 hypothetical protein B5M09_011495 [Aphanomyces astaci]|eukprot:XP_009824034.1 hypothetical protein H257_02196 [Aphanomyces astaci]
MSLWRNAVWVVAAVTAMLYSAMNTFVKTDSQHEHVQEVMGRVRAAQIEIQVTPLNTSIVDHLRRKLSTWRDNWTDLLVLEETNQKQIASHWERMKDDMLANVAAKNNELTQLRESERELMQHLHEWRALQHEIEVTTADIASIQADIVRQRNENAALRRDAIARGQAAVSRQADMDEFRRILTDEATTARDAATFHRRVLTSIAVAGGILSFGAVMITLRARWRTPPPASRRQ